MATAVTLPKAQTPQATPGFGLPSMALVLGALFWSGNFIAGRALRGQIDPLPLNFLRWSLALLILAPFVWRSVAASLPVLRREWKLIMALGATGLAGFHSLTYLALQTTTATNALLVLSLAPIATLFGSAALGMERPTPPKILGAVISILGAGVLITRGDLASIVAHGFNTGDLLMLLGIFIWAAYSLLLRRRPADLSPAVSLAASAAAALALMAPLLVLGPPLRLEALRSIPVLLNIGYIALFASAIGFMLWTYGVAKLGPARAGQFVHLMPIYGMALAYVLLGEAPTPAQLVGAVLVLSGIAVFESRARENPLKTKEKLR
jgi:drug/metabolite transporter (DMT)-like permease